MGYSNRLGVMAFGLASGIVWGLGMLVLGLASTWFMWGTPLVVSMGSFYTGYEPTVWGSFVGGLWGFCDGFIGGVVFAWLYNMFSCKKCCNDRPNCSHGGHNHTHTGMNNSNTNPNTSANYNDENR